MTSRIGSAAGALRRSGRRALGAIAGQLTQALASFALQLVAAHALGAAGLGLFATLYGAILLGTAISTGMIGDSLTVLDRSDAAIRAALSRWCLLIAAAFGLAGAAVAYGVGALSAEAAVLFALASAVFLVEDALRRMLMATARFWSLPLVDGASLAVSLVVMLVVHESGGRLTIGTFVLALLVGQLVASVLALARLPRHERSISPRGDAAMRAVFAYGSWRSVQLSLRPATLTAARILITLVAGATAFGQLEAARVYMAPALLLVNGMGSFMLTMFVEKRSESHADALRRSDRVAAILLVGTMVMGVIGTALAPLLGGLITGGDYDLDAVAVLGWAVYAASSAALLPYTSLAAVRGKQRSVTGVRTLDPILSLALVAPAAAFAVSSSPYAIAVGSFLAGVAIRVWVLRPMAEGRERTRNYVSRHGVGSAAPVDTPRAATPMEGHPMTTETYGELVQRLRVKAGKSNRGAGGYTRWVNRLLGRLIAAFAYQRGWTPNQMTVLSACLTIPAIAAIALFEPSWPLALGIAVVLLAGYAFDAADGQLARLRGGGSMAGEYLDHCVDAVKTSTLHLAILICWFRFYDLDHAAWLLIPIAFAAVHPIFFFSLMLSDAMKARVVAAGPAEPAPTGPPSAEPAPVLPSLLVLPNDWGVVCICMALLAAHDVFGVAYTLLLAVNTLFLLAGLVRWYRRLCAADLQRAGRNAEQAGPTAAPEVRVGAI